MSPAHSESIAFREESTLILIMGLPSNEQKVSEEEHSEDNALSECSTIYEIPEEIEHEQEQEQSFATAPTIAGPSTDPAKFRTPSVNVPRDKGKGRAIWSAAMTGLRLTRVSSIALVRCERRVVYSQSQVGGIYTSKGTVWLNTP